MAFASNPRNIKRNDNVWFDGDEHWVADISVRWEHGEPVGYAKLYPSNGHGTNQPAEFARFSGLRHSS